MCTGPAAHTLIAAVHSTPTNPCAVMSCRLGLPTSSSQCITGGIVGVGLMEGFSRGVNWKLFGKQFMSWVSTLFVVGLGVAAVFAQVRQTLFQLLLQLGYRRCSAVPCASRSVLAQDKF